MSLYIFFLYIVDSIEEVDAITNTFFFFFWGGGGKGNAYISGVRKKGRKYTFMFLELVSYIFLTETC